LNHKVKKNNKKITSLLLMDSSRSFISVLLTLVVTRIVSLENFGVITVITSVPLIFSTYSCFGLDRAILLVDEKNLIVLIRSAFTGILIIATVCTGVTLITVNYAFDSNNNPSLHFEIIDNILLSSMAMIFILGTGTASLVDQLALREGHHVRANAISSVPIILYLLLQILFLVIIKNQITALLLGLLIGWLATFLISIILIPSESRRPINLIRFYHSLKEWKGVVFTKSLASGVSQIKVQGVYLICSKIQPFGLELIAVLRIFDMGASAASRAIARSWGLLLASINWRVNQKTTEEINSLVKNYISWLIYFILPAWFFMITLIIFRKFLFVENWELLIQFLVPISFAGTCIVFLSWLEKIFEYQRRYFLGLQAEIMLLIFSITASIAANYVGSIVIATWIILIASGLGQFYRAYIALGNYSLRSKLLIYIFIYSLGSSIIAWMSLCAG
jgi:hypothetical protein